MESYKELFEELNWQLKDAYYNEHYGDIYDEIKDAYHCYLESDEWKEKREQRLNIDGHKCTKCGSTEKLNIHHLSYKNIGDERMEDLVTVCKSCHKKIHKHE